MRSSWLTLSALPVLCIACIPASAATIHVPGGQPTIQAGIDAASAGDTVLVACDTYYEHEIEMKSGVYLTSETGQSDCVTVDAQQQGRVFYCDGVDSLASVVGLTIAGGLVSGSYPDNKGGGMLCTSSSPTLTACTLSGNSAEWGGGMYCTNSSPTLIDCVFEGNEAVGDNADGGGLACGEASPSLERCSFIGNASEGSGGGIGGWWPPCSPKVVECIFVENTAVRDGAGVCFSSCTPTRFDNCTFSGNSAGRAGGGLWGEYASFDVVGCTFCGNTAGQSGGGVGCMGSSTPTFTNCIIAFSGAGGSVGGEDAPTLNCCDIYGNVGGDWVGFIADQQGTNGNFSEDPLFCDMDGEDLRLDASSPCLSGGNDCEVLIGAQGEGCDSPVEMNSWGAIKSMYR